VYWLKMWKGVLTSFFFLTKSLVFWKTLLSCWTAKLVAKASVWRCKVVFSLWLAPPYKCVFYLKTHYGLLKVATAPPTKKKKTTRFANSYEVEKFTVRTTIWNRLIQTNDRLKNKRKKTSSFWWQHFTIFLYII
jgi:hypothetical protein